jgi:hypothetical protein
MRHFTLLAAALVLGGCVSVAAQEPAVLDGECRNEPLAQFAGQEASQQLGADILRASGAKALQWINPGQAVTMDFRSERVRVTLDASGRVESARCG